MTAPGTSFPWPPLPDSGMEAIAGGANDGDDFAVVRRFSGSGSGSGIGSGSGTPAVPKCCS